MDSEQGQRERAYKIWEEEGRPSGKHEEHWAQASQGSNMPTRQAEEVTEANEAANARFKGKKPQMAPEPLANSNPD
ncbi:DUF2934 domain-containing protein [Allorhizobium sp. NPDC080224]|uniref:DUF2934 domain-containing protein n=1 Tax=Allorhizobium sp. NPDC080224 TaxID=3390547 RepID=UPI003D085F6C